MEIILRSQFKGTNFTQSLNVINGNVHFVLKQNEPKIQGCEKIGGGH
jgi:hypothetical protein